MLKSQKRKETMGKKGLVNLVGQPPGTFFPSSSSLFISLSLLLLLLLLINAKRKSPNPGFEAHAALFTGDASLPPLATLSPLMRPSSDAGLKIEATRGQTLQGT